MAQPVPHQAADKRRVKVYELRNNDWFDRGTGFCTATFAATEQGRKDPRVIVESEDQPERLLLETKIHKEDGFQKQQGKPHHPNTALRFRTFADPEPTETLIVWQEPGSGVDMALSFQEAEGCALIWRFVSNVQQALQNNTAIVEDGLSDDLAMEVPAPVSLPAADLGNLAEMESSMRIMTSTANGRDALAKAIMAEDYIGKLIPLVEMAEDLESLPDLHRLCNIMKTILLLNDTTIIEHAVSDECVLGVVGALEYDPDFPSHKANHRHWLKPPPPPLARQSRPLQGGGAHRGRADAPKDSPDLPSAIPERRCPCPNPRRPYVFGAQLVDILQPSRHRAALAVQLGFFGRALWHLQRPPSRPEEEERGGAIHTAMLRDCQEHTATGPPDAVIHFGLRHGDVAVRVGATDIMISIIDHDPHMIRQTIYRQMHENQSGLTDSLIELLLIEVDLGVKSQISEALKVLLDQGMVVQGPEHFAKVNGEVNVRPRPQPSLDPQQELFLTRFYERSALKLFQPLVDLEDRTDMNLTVQQASMFTYLVDILCFFIRQHHRFSRYFVLNNNIASRVCQLLGSPEKYLRLVAIRFIRHLVGLQEEFYMKHLTEKQVFGPILDVVIETLPRDNLLSSASLELFEHIKKENIKEVVKHLVANYRERLVRLSYLPTFRDIVLRYDQTQGYTANVDYLVEGEGQIAKKPPPPSTRLMEHISLDPAEEEYWNTSDPEDEDDEHHGEKASSTNGSATSSRPLVDYPSDEDSDENTNPEAETKVKDDEAGFGSGSGSDISADQEARSPPVVLPPLERVSEKRRREEDEEDELGKLMHSKRRNSSSSESNASVTARSTARRRSVTPNSGNGPPRKISISLSPTVKTGVGDGHGEES
ncbi:suppressor of Mek1 [Ophiocordyceps sinensis CO18]|uniref:Suppressor of Mek1 n=1 Tax=Ophiocordyceps sinensis (strain Co18 / CGMCC 3.14243) TaxID=911162 RepID=T4ZXK2_OPHSC|nr:suppressor of Mek1 [Ophiocordyceps sinensis CO18]